MNHGFLTCEADAEYRKQADTHLTSHALADFRRCPLCYKQKRDGIIVQEETASFLVGRAGHTLILEGGDAFEETYAVGGPVNPKTGKCYGRDTKAFKDWADDLGKPVITDEQYSLITSMAIAVREHPIARELLRPGDGLPERTVRVQYRGRACQGRIDWFHPRAGIVDLKTCDDLSWFEQDARRFEYSHQLAFYRELVRIASGQTFSVIIVAVEKKQPYRCGVWTVDDALLEIARGDNEAAMGMLAACEQTDQWPTLFEEWRTLRIR